MIYGLLAILQLIFRCIVFAIVGFAIATLLYFSGALSSHAQLRERVRFIWARSDNVEIAEPMTKDAIYTQFQIMKGH